MRTFTFSFIGLLFCWGGMAYGNEAMQTLLAESQSLQQQGLYRQAQGKINQALKILETSPDNPRKLTALLHLANISRVNGDPETALRSLGEAESIARTNQDAPRLSLIYLNQGRVSQSQKAWEKAYQQYQQAEVAARPTDREEKLYALVEQFQLLAQWRPQSASALLPSLGHYLSQVPPQETIAARLTLAKSILTLPQYDVKQVLTLLTSTLRDTQTHSHRRFESTTLGTLGQLYLQQGQPQDAVTFFHQALALAQSIQADELAYQWHGYLGRIYRSQGNLPLATQAYQAAYANLQRLRSDITAFSTEVQFSFRAEVEPTYRTLIDLLIPPNGERASQEALRQARQVLESLQLAELDNFLHESCLDARPQQIDDIDPKAAVIYPIVLPQRLVVIYALPGKPLSYHTEDVSQVAVEEMSQQMLQSLRQESFVEERLPPAKALFDWIIRPIEAELQATPVHSLVFVLDGALRNIPMAATYDGTAYLIERYNLALTPGLQLLPPTNAGTLSQSVLIGGISQGTQGFLPLPAVAQEVNRLSQLLQVTPLLNQNLTTDRLTAELKGRAFPIVHLATHAQFSSDPEETFILTWDDRINAQALATLLQQQSQPMELLVLSACETASGDNRATLGLAGIALRSGARSTIASLWAIQDQSTSLLMGALYQNLQQPNTPKAAALRQAQLTLLADPQYRHPYFWAPFVLIGHWL